VYLHASSGQAQYRRIDHRFTVNRRTPVTVQDDYSGGCNLDDAGCKTAKRACFDISGFADRYEPRLHAAIVIEIISNQEMSVTLLCPFFKFSISVRAVGCLVIIMMERQGGCTKWRRQDVRKSRGKRESDAVREHHSHHRICTSLAFPTIQFLA
jgi:hypothetical protein